MKLKKTLSLILALAMILVLFATVGTALADGEDDPADDGTYKLWVNNEQFTDDHLTVQCGEGTATFDPATTTLTLDNAQITKGYEMDQLGTGVLSFLDEELTIIVNGDCTITETGGDGIGSYDMDEEYNLVSHDITVKGDGKLTITESEPWYGYGFYCTGNLTLEGVEIEIHSVATGVWANRALNVKDSKLNVSCSTQFSGFVVNSGSAVFDRSEVYAESASGAGILLGNDLESSSVLVSSGSVTLKGKIGVVSDTDGSTVYVTGGKLAIEGQDAAFSENFLTDVDQHIILGEGVEVTSGAVDGVAVTFESSHVHSYEAAVTDPTCTERGYTTHTCSCGDSYVDTYVDALGHDWDDGVVTTPATATAEGVKTFTCRRCGETRTEAVPVQPGVDTSTVFTDVKAKSWFKKAVDFVYNNKLMDGVGNGKFAPNDPMNRAMLVTVLWRMEGEPEVSVSVPFTDLKAKWYKKAVAWAYSNNIVNGINATTFDPTAPLTREQIAAIMYRYTEFKGGDVSGRADLSGFPDGGKVHSYAKTAMSWAVAEGLISGVKSGNVNLLDPRGNATRAQVATILMRYLES